VRRSGLFDEGHYLRQGLPPEAGRAPIRHYLAAGAEAGLDPCPWFRTVYYAALYPESAVAGRNPLVDFVLHGAARLRSPSPEFDTEAWAERFPESVRGGSNPLAHFLARGADPGELRRVREDVEPLRAAEERHAAGPAPWRVLIADARVPTPDRDSGSVRMFAIIKLLRRLGRDVTFVAAEPGRDPGCERSLRQLGVELVTGLPAGRRHLAERGHEYAHAILSRPEVAEHLVLAVRAHAPRARLVYDTVDLHWVRMERAAALTGDPVVRAAAERFGRLERFLVDAADETLTVTDVERETILRERPAATVSVFPNIHEVAPGATPWAGRRDLVFIGGFDHAPNVDAVVWFAREILPLVRRRLPGVVFRVVGSRAPSLVRKLEGEAVKVLGFVPDVAPVFDASRVFVSPLRFGAGMKGKVGHSMSLGLPIVTTSIGAEGMGLADGDLALIADDPEAFAAAVVRLYEDEQLWLRLSTRGVEHVRARYSEEAVAGRLSALFPATSERPREAAGARVARTARVLEALVRAREAAGLEVPAFDRTALVRAQLLAGAGAGR
jgi:glycosyltransferase involved in cell wall biosynthesis